VPCVFVPTHDDVQLLAVIPYIPVGTTTTPAQHRAYEESLFLTAVDRRNRSRGYCRYLPDTYERARLYWDLAYGVHLPSLPQTAGSEAVLFVLIESPLGQQVVPISTLARYGNQSTVSSVRGLGSY
jgi:hypothetical protein